MEKFITPEMKNEIVAEVLKAIQAGENVDLNFYYNIPTMSMVKGDALANRDAYSKVVFNANSMYILDDARYWAAEEGIEIDEAAKDYVLREINNNEGVIEAALVLLNNEYHNRNKIAD